MIIGGIIVITVLFGGSNYYGTHFKSKGNG